MDNDLVQRVTQLEQHCQVLTEWVATLSIALAVSRSIDPQALQEDLRLRLQKLPEVDGGQTIATGLQEFSSALLQDMDLACLQDGVMKARGNRNKQP